MTIPESILMGLSIVCGNAAMVAALYLLTRAMKD